MKIFPAIDIRGGKVVRLKYGDYNQEERYEITPLQAAEDFAACGAEYLHVVDLDGAKDGKRMNFEIIHEIVSTTGMFVEVGGGIRTQESIEAYLDAGADRVILGTIALENLPFLRDMLDLHGDRIAVGIDAKDGCIATQGWISVSRVNAEQHARRCGDPMNVGTIIYTDIGRDGALEGANIELYRRLHDNCNSKIIASGGITTLEDVAALRDIGVEGAIIGKALYTGRLDLRQVLAVAKGEQPC